MLKMVYKVAPWLPFNIGKVKSEGPIPIGKCINLATGLSRKGRTYFSDPTKTIKRGFTSVIVLFDYKSKTKRVSNTKFSECNKELWPSMPITV